LRLIQAILIFIFSCSCILITRSQDISFSQFYSNPLYLNPAFAGSVNVPRLALQYRNQWPGFDKAYRTYSMGFDFPIQSNKGGVGLLLMNDAQANSTLNRFDLEVMYSRIIKLNKNYNLRGALQAGLHQNSLVWGNLIFPDNLDASYGQSGISQETPITDPNFMYFDVATGILLYNKNIFLGLSGHHLNEPKQSFYTGQEEVGVLYRKYSMHFGANFDVYIHGKLRKKFVLSPQVVIQKQASFWQFNYGTLMNMRGMTAGVWLRQNYGFRYDALIFLVGIMANRWQMTYSYDWTISGLAGLSGGTNEITISFLLKNPNKESTYPFFNLPKEY
jgi:type IX secretion system PorP/SprF family membrane protein